MKIQPTDKDEIIREEQTEEDKFSIVPIYGEEAYNDPRQLMDAARTIDNEIMHYSGTEKSKEMKEIRAALHRRVEQIRARKKFTEKRTLKPRPCKVISIVTV